MAKADPAPPRRDPSKRAAILAVAWETFLRDGYAGASMSEITDRVGGSKSTIYSHFRSKEEIFLAGVQQKADEIYADLHSLPQNSGDLTEDLVDFGDRLLGIVLSEEYVSFYRLVVAEAARFPVIGQAEYENRRRKLLGPVGTRLRDEMASGRLRVSDPLEAAEVLWNLLSASLHRRALTATGSRVTSKEIHHQAERAVTIFLAAYGSARQSGES